MTLNMQDISMQLFGVSVNSKGIGNIKQNGSEAFDSFMNQTVNKLQNTISSDEKSEVNNTSNNPFKNRDLVRNESVSRSFAKANIQKSEPEKVTEEMFEDALSAAVSVATMIMEEFDISEEELSSVLEANGMSSIDLLDKDKFTQLFMKLSDMTEGDMLTDDEFFDHFEEILEQFDVLTKDVVKDFSELASVTEEDFSKAFELSLSDRNNTAIEPSEDEQMQGIEVEVIDEREKVGSDAKSENNTASSDKNEQDDAEIKKTDTEKTVSKGSKSTKADMSFINTMTEIYTQNIDDEALKLDMSVQMREISLQIIDKIRVVITEDNKFLELQLNPEHLGRVSLNIEQVNGQMTARFVTESQTAKQAIESQMSMFKEAIAEKGIKVSEIEVTVSDFAFNGEGKDQSDNFTNSHKKRSSFKLADVSDISSETDEFAGQMTTVAGMGENINYLA